MAVRVATIGAAPAVAVLDPSRRRIGDNTEAVHRTAATGNNPAVARKTLARQADSTHAAESNNMPAAEHR